MELGHDPRAFVQHRADVFPMIRWEKTVRLVGRNVQLEEQA
jgi:hypothetical protein